MSQPEMLATTNPAVATIQSTTDTSTPTADVGEYAAALLAMDRPFAAINAPTVNSAREAVLNAAISQRADSRIFLPVSLASAWRRVATAAGIPDDHIIAIPERRDRATDLRRLERELRHCAERQHLIGLVVVNGGAGYDQTIDDIHAAVKLRDQIAQEYTLPYRPHVHVESDTGWAWLTFASCDWSQLSARFAGTVVRNLRRQYQRIDAVRHADSWLIDPATATHFPARPVVLFRPDTRPSSDTSTSADQIEQIGDREYQRRLATMTDAVHYVRFLVKKHTDIHVANVRSDGTTVALRLLPPGMIHHAVPNELPARALPTQRQIQHINRYSRALHDWIQPQLTGHWLTYATDYGVSAAGTTVEAIVLRPDIASTRQTIRDQVEWLVNVKRQFNRTVWSHTTAR